MVPSGGTLGRTVRACGLLVTLIAVALAVHPAMASATIMAEVHGELLVGRPAPGFGNPPTCMLQRPSAGCGAQHGVDVWVIPIEPEWQGHWFWARGEADHDRYDLQVFFYDAGDTLLMSRTGSDKDEMGHIPSTATTAVVMSYFGGDIPFRFSVCSCA